MKNGVTSLKKDSAGTMPVEAKIKVFIFQ